jgi:ubiquinone/menaquinone biosynthesis C-methylase UbiE
MINQQARDAREYYQKYVQYISVDQPILDQFDFQNRRVLEVGCGLGDALLYIRRKFAISEGIGLDASMGSVMAAQARNSFTDLRFTCGDVLVMELPEMRYDYILSFGVLHYYSQQDMNRMLGKMVRALNPNGKIVLFIFKPHPLHFLRKTIQSVLTSSRLIKVFERMGDVQKRNVIMNILNPPRFRTYSVREISDVAKRNGLVLRETVRKGTHVLPYLMPFSEKVSRNFSALVMRLDLFNFLSFGNYYILEKREPTE